MVRLIEKANIQEWHNYRNTGLGASEVPTLLGYNQYQSCLELFHRKVGIINKPYINRKMLRGKATEQFTSECFMAWDGIEDNHAMNMEAKKYLRQCEKFSQYAYIANDDVPHLFVSPDRKIINSLRGLGTLEIKDTVSQYLNSYIDRISIPHIIQTKTQMFVGEFRWGVLAYIIDGANEYKEHEYYRDGIIFDDKKNEKIITEDDLKSEVYLFWKKVLLARELIQKIKKAKYEFNNLDANKYQALLDELEPEPDSTLAYEAYLKESYYSFAKPSIIIQGTIEHEQIAEAYIKAKENLKQSTDLLQLQKNKILSICRNGYEINIGKGKYIKVDATQKGTLIKVKY